MLWIKQVSCVFHVVCNKLVLKNVTKVCIIHSLPQKCLLTTTNMLFDKVRLLNTKYMENMLNTNHPSEDTLRQLREMILKNNVANEDNVDSIIFQELLSLKKRDVAFSYISFLKNHNYSISTGLKTIYLRALTNNQTLSKADEEEIIEFYEKSKQEGLLSIPHVTKSVIISLSVTRRWKECINLYEDFINIGEDSHKVCCAVVYTAFRHGLIEYGLKHFIRALRIYPNENYMPLVIAYINYIQGTKQQLDFNKYINRMFTLWSKFNMFPTVEAINAYAKACKKFGWKVEHALISNNGTCSVCQKFLTRRISINDFNKLRQCIMSDKFFGTNIYHSSTPKELIDFKRFVVKSGPYDVVIDGLNVLYASKRIILKDVAFELVRQNKKVLIVARKHMSHIFKEWKSNVFYYLLDNLTVDDKFLLYATFASGYNTTLVSSDMMRQHKYHLRDLKMQLLFKRWQWYHQYTIKRVNHEYNIIKPLKYEPYAQKNDNTWHIPYNKPDDELTPPTDWICFTCKDQENQECNEPSLQVVAA